MKQLRETCKNRRETRADAEERISLELSVSKSLIDIVDDADAAALAKASPPRPPKAKAKGKAHQPTAKSAARPSQRPRDATAKTKASPPPPKAHASASTAEAETGRHLPGATTKANATAHAEVVDVAARGAVVIAIATAFVPYRA